MPQTNVIPDWKATYPTDAKAQKPPIMVAITNATWATGNATFTTASAHGWVVGNTVVISGINPAGYNGTFVAGTGTTGSTIVVPIAANPGAFVSGGQTSKVLNISLGANAVPNKPTFATGTIQSVSLEAEEEAAKKLAAKGKAKNDDDEDEKEEKKPATHPGKPAPTHR